MKMLREIIWLTPDLSGLGGSEYLVACFCHLLGTHGVHVHVITKSVHPSWKRVLEAREGPGQISLCEVNSNQIHDFSAVIDLVVRRSTISLMQVMPLESFCFDVIRSKEYDFPICGLEPTDLSDKCWWLPGDLETLFPCLDGLIVLNPNAESTARLKYHFGGPVRIISNSVMDDMYQEPDRRYPFSTFGCISRLSAEKGLEYLLGAFSLLSKRHPAITLSIWGDGEDRDRLYNQAKMLSIEDRICFHGAFHPFDDSLAISESAGVFVLPSLFEGCPTSLLELASRGKPLISSDTSGGKWLLGADYPGLVPVADTGSLARVMEQTLTDPSFCPQLTGYVLKRSNSLFQSAHTRKQLVSFYNSILASCNN